MACCAPWLVQAAAPVPAQGSNSPSALLDVLAEELDYSTRHLATPEGTRPYFISLWHRQDCAPSPSSPRARGPRDDDDRRRHSTWTSGRRFCWTARTLSAGSGRASSPVSAALPPWWRGNDQLAISMRFGRRWGRVRSALERFRQVKTDLKNHGGRGGTAHVAAKGQRRHGAGRTWLRAEIKDLTTRLSRASRSSISGRMPWPWLAPRSRYVVSAQRPA
jgi:hypothetical protein